MNSELAAVAAVAWMLAQLSDGGRDAGSSLTLTTAPARGCRVVFYTLATTDNILGGGQSSP